ncbi:MAG: tyrosine-type recombinase/integrase, partial [Ardenticatenales bacterium]|nr:tyrosine-type recombinase/integrase [Ardenticatenales bacterium]
SSGLRVSELASLKSEQLVERDGGHFLLVLGKNDVVPREAPLSKEARAAAGVDCEYIFTSFGGRGGRLTETSISTVGAWQAVQRYSTQIGLADVKPHDFRTQLAKGDIRQAQKALGHKRIDTTAAHYVLDELEPNLTDDLY